MSNKFWEQLGSVENKPVLSISLYESYLSAMVRKVESEDNRDIIMIKLAEQHRAVARGVSRVIMSF